MGVAAPTLIVIVEVPDPGAEIGVGVKLTVVPLGTPVADRATWLLNPPLPVVVIRDVPWLPCPRVKDDGDAETVKLGPCDCVTVRVTVVVGDNPPPVAVTVMG